MVRMLRLCANLRCAGVSLLADQTRIWLNRLDQVWRMSRLSRDLVKTEGAHRYTIAIVNRSIALAVPLHVLALRCLHV